MLISTATLDTATKSDLAGLPAALRVHLAQLGDSKDGDRGSTIEGRGQYSAFI